MKRLLLLILALAACGSNHNAANYSDETDQLEVLSWWVSPSEKPAFESLVDAFKKANPGVTVTDGSAAGSGSNVQVVLASRLLANDPPDVGRALSMDDAVYGELIANHATEGTDFGRTAFPGTDGKTSPSSTPSSQPGAPRTASTR